MKRQYRFKYGALRGMDIFFSHARDPRGGLIRFAQTGSLSSAANRSITNHCGFVFDLWGQYVAAELTGSGMTIHSLEKYCSDSNQILEVFRCKAFDDEGLYKIGHTILAESLRRRMEYDWFGAALSSPVGKKLLGWLPFVKNSKNKNFCSENVYSVLLSCGEELPSKWIKNPPTPIELYAFCVLNKNNFQKVVGWRTRTSR